MFRRAVFALMLIGAAFAGGAAINGPGLAWLQRNFANPSIIVDDTSARPSTVAKAPPRQFPTAQAPPFLVDLPQTSSPPAPGKKAKAEASSPSMAQVDPPLLPESPSTPASALAPLPGPGPVDEGDPPVPPLPAVAEAPSRPSGPEPAPLPSLGPGPIPKTDPVARLASVERPEPPSSTAASPTWAELRRRMKALGIVRYTIEAETDGRVRFTCVIPVDGLKAVGHHFEAEGDDEPQAAEAALKRIALWKATAPD